MGLLEEIPASWRKLLEAESSSLPWAALEDFLAGERANETVFPPADRIFAALTLTPPESVRVVIVGQDPYHDDGQAHGLAFSVPDKVKIPPSLRNIFKELESDLGIAPPASGDLTAWAEQGVLLLNSVLTVRAHQAASHQKKGWEEITDSLLRSLGKQQEPIVFVLWGAWAQSKAKWIDGSRHLILQSVHPSPLSAHRGFFGSKPFSRANAFLVAAGRGTIDWSAIGTAPEAVQPELEFV